jgi:uncharacterized protein YfkK (UPF0435 family)
MKKYVMSYDRIRGKVVQYTDEVQAQLQQINYVVIEAETFQQAKEQYLERRIADVEEE